jgi:hypothetical protein
MTSHEAMVEFEEEKMLNEWERITEHFLYL